MNLEKEVENKVYRMEELHNNFSNGDFEEMNACYSEKFQGWLYRPSDDSVQQFNAEEIKEGNQGAATYYKGKDINFTYSGLSIIPQSENQAAVSYEIKYQHKEGIVRAFSLEVWQKESDGVLRMIRWYEEKSATSVGE